MNKAIKISKFLYFDDLRVLSIFVVFCFYWRFI